MDTQQALLRAILLNPADDVARLVYADWLEEYGNDAARAEFIRDTLANWHRVYKLWDEISSCIPAAMAAGFGREDETGLPRWTFNLPYRFGKTIYSRGFMSEIHLPLDAFTEHAKAVFSAHPIERVTLVDSGVYWRGGPAGSVMRPFWWASDSIYDHDCLPRAICPEGEYETLTEARQALSDACVAYGRSLAGLPPLPGTAAGSPE